MPSTTFLNYIHNFRAIAILFVVAAHMFLRWDLENEVPLSKVALDVLWRNGTVLFVFIAGFLFQYLKRGFVYLDYLKRKFKYVILPYLLLSVPLILYRILLAAPEDLYLTFNDYESWSILKKVGFMLITGTHLLPYWFIPMIFLYYLISPIFLKLDQFPKLYTIVLPVLIILSLVVERGNRGDLHNIHLSFIHFLSVYIAGMFFSNFSQKIHHWTNRYKLLVFSMMVAAIILCYFYYQTDYFDQLIYIQKILLCWVLLFLLIKIDKKGWLRKFSVLKYLANYSFGIYFIHYIVFMVLKKVAEAKAPYLLNGSILNWIIIFLVTLFITITLVAIVKKLAGKYSRYLIGS